MSETRLPHIRLMKEEDLEQVLAWRNHPEIRRYMYNKDEISLKEHTRWFYQESRDPEKRLLIFSIGTSPLGFVKIHQIANGGIGEWGFYVAPGSPKGSGNQLGKSAIEYAFNEVGLRKLCGYVLVFNQRSVQFHLKLGFCQEGLLRKQHFDGQQYHDVVFLGLLLSDWLSKK